MRRIERSMLRIYLSWSSWTKFRYWYGRWIVIKMMRTNIPFTLLMYSQFLRDAAQRFAEKCSCSDIVKSEYRRRAASDGKSAEVCRYSAVGEKGIFLASEKIDGIIHVEKYNKISDRWDIFQILKIAAITERTSFGIIFDQSKLFLIGGLKGTTNVATVSFVAIFRKARDYTPVKTTRVYDKRRIYNLFCRLVHLRLVFFWMSHSMSFEIDGDGSNWLFTFFFHFSWKRWAHLSWIHCNNWLKEKSKLAEGTLCRFYSTTIFTYLADGVEQLWEHVNGMDKFNYYFAMAHLPFSLLQYFLGHNDRRINWAYAVRSIWLRSYGYEWENIRCGR